MPSLSHLLLNFLELRAHAVASGFPFDLELSAAACAADQGVSRPAGFHRQPLAEPSARLSPHSAPIRQTCPSRRAPRVRRGPPFPGKRYLASDPSGPCELHGAG